MPSPSGPLGDLAAESQHFLSLSIAASTKQTYSSGEKRFVDFLCLYRPASHHSFPVTEDTLIQYVTYLARSIKHSSIKSYLAAVRHLHIREGYQLDLKSFLRLQLVCRGIKRAQGSSLRTRLPITIRHLRLFYSLLALRYSSNPNYVMIWAAMTLAFFGFLRLGELTCNGAFSPERHLSPGISLFYLPPKLPSTCLSRSKYLRQTLFAWARLFSLAEQIRLYVQFKLCWDT